MKLVFTSHNVMPHENGKYDFRLQSLVLKSSSGIVAHTEFIKNKLLEIYHVTGDKVHVIAHGNFDTYLPEKTISKTRRLNNG